jgi:hypothetical protein
MIIDRMIIDLDETPIPTLVHGGTTLNKIDRFIFRRRGPDILRNLPIQTPI